MTPLFRLAGSASHSAGSIPDVSRNRPIPGDAGMDAGIAAASDGISIYNRLSISRSTRGRSGALAGITLLSVPACL